LPQWYAGREAIRTFFASAWKAYDGYRLIPAAANRQPAFVAYSRAKADAPWTAHSVHVLSLEHDMISRLTLFYRPSERLLTAFGRPLILADDTRE
jgi:RNA polymerase sigma-70 factor (ECF subfamily)